MNDTLKYIVDKFKLEPTSKGGVEIYGINRTIMAQTLGELGFKLGVEVGVAEGNHAKVLFESIPDLTLYCVDIYKKYPGYEEYKDPSQCYIEAKAKLPKADFVTEFSMEAVETFGDDTLDFVYIDAGHDFKNVAMDVCEWSKKVKVGGIVFGHDFKRSKRNVVDVKDVIPAYCYAKKINPWFILTNDIVDPSFGRDNPGWMFVRQETDQL